jgi:hypothetical protein
VGDVLVADLQAVPSQLLDGRLHVDGVPVHDGIEGEAKAAKLFFLPLLKRASDFAAAVRFGLAWRVIAMLRSPAYRALSLSGHKILSRIEIELADHGGDKGRENGAWGRIAHRARSQLPQPPLEC